jgi:predicted N-formylglutamate amidohydrolase
MSEQAGHVHETDEASEVVGWPAHGRVVLSCEHASNRLPDPIKPGRLDRPWLETHWAYDIGAAELVREIVRNTGSVAVLSRFSRLFCDANRDPADPTVIVPRVAQHALEFNEFLSPSERALRIDRYHSAFHARIDKLLEERLPMGGYIALVSVHSFVPILYGLQRELDVGVLFNPYEAIARRLAQSLEGRGLTTALNEPYSGRRGLIYSAERHGLNHQIVYLELEVNQALLSTPAKVYHLARIIAEAISELRLRTGDRDRSVQSSR